MLWIVSDTGGGYHARVSVGETLGSTAGPEQRDGAVAAGAELVVALECDRPAALSARHSLAAVSEVLLGRGARRAAARAGAPEVLTVTVPDRWMSSRHARLQSSFGRWIVEDLGSKNGARVNGEPVTRRELADGDLIELGHTLLIFRARVERAVEAGRDVDLAGAVEAETGVATFAPGLERELGNLRQLAGADLPVLLTGESGTGKEVLARAFHAFAAARTGRTGELVAVNCGAIPANLVESELFGHKKGAFSGAFADSAGLVRAADGGTLFLDEIADLPPPSQAVLLRVLQEREVRPVGDTRSVPVDLRLVSATHRDLPALVARGEFREDLYARVSGFRVAVPPLRERRDDLGIIIGVLLARAAGGAPPAIDPDVARVFFAHDWPRNIRELETTLRAALVLSGGETIELSHLPADLSTGVPAAPPPRPLEPDELARRDQLEALLRAHAGNVSAVARAMGKDRKQVHRWLERYGLSPDPYRA